MDLILLDIEMPQLNGIDFAKNLTQKAQIIFTTAYPQVGFEGFNVKAVDYLLKPNATARSLQTIKKESDQLK